MKMTFQILGILALSTCVATPASAVLVDVLFDNGTPSANGGALTITEVTNTVSSTGGPTASLGYTVTGLTIDSNGTSDDSIAFEFALLATGADAGTGVRGIGFSGGAMGVNSIIDNPPPSESSELDLAGESLAFSLTTSTVTLGAGATESATIDFIGFTGFEVQAFFGDDRYILSGGTSADGSDKTDDPANFDPHPVFTIAFDASSPGNGFRIEQIAASFEAAVTVPEPSSAGLCCLGAIGWAARRRRKTNNMITNE